MNGGAIWWDQLGTSRRFLKQIQDNMEACRSVILCLPENMPWKSYFYTTIDIQKASFSSERQLQRIKWTAGVDPGAFVLAQLCSGVVQADYFPGQTYAEYLGGRGDILLCDYYVWVTGIKAKDDLGKWVEFITRYNAYSKHLEKRAVFILEYDGLGYSTDSVPRIYYTIEDIDCHVFCLEAASALANTAQRDYQSELALCVGGGDPEFSAALLQSGDDFLNDPVLFALAIIANKTRSDHTKFINQTQEKISSSVWKASIRLLFPMLEQWRFDLISKHEDDLRIFLPITNSNGEKVSEPYDLEIGTLFFIAVQHSQIFSKTEYDQLKLCRTVRNKLAHNQIVSRNEAAGVMSLS